MTATADSDAERAESGSGPRAGIFPALLALALVAIMALAMLIGPVPLTPGEVLDGFFAPVDESGAIIVRELRLPRVILGAIVGAALGISGAAMQGLFQNPLAEPGIVGVSASASAGAVFALYFGLTSSIALAVPVSAMAGAMLGMLILFTVAMRDASVLTLILVGVALNAFAGALTALALNLSPNPFALNDIVLWLMGSLTNRSFLDVWLAAPFVMIGGAILFASRRGLAALTLGEEAARSLGVNVRSLRAQVIAGSALAVGASVAVTGAIGFVGLVVPHVVRPFVAHDPARILLPSALGGAILVVLADIAVRLAPGGQELKLGVVTALLGAPFFLYLVIATRRAMR